MHCWPVSLKACDGAPPPGDTRSAIPSAVRKRQVAVQYLHAASLSTDRGQRAHLRRLAAELILAR
jgi:hypothetical protein